MNAGIRTLLRLIGASIAMVAAVNSLAAEDAARDRVYAMIAHQAGAIRTITSDFEQERRLGLLDAVVTSRGRFNFKKEDRMRWEFTEPNRSGFAVTGDQGKRWETAADRPERFSLRQAPFIKVFTDQVFAWAKADFDGLQRAYRVEVAGEQPVDLKLIPLLPQMKEHLDHVRILFAADARHVVLIEVMESDGDFTRIRFSNTYINLPLSDDLFE
jgi:outer membrane lipoprotein-sorting protein